MSTTRRGLLAAMGGTATIGVAGCLGNVGGSEAGDCNISDEPKVQKLQAPSMGPDDAPVVVKAWEDYVCPHCATFSLEVLPKIQSNFIDSGDVRYAHHDYPLPMSEKWSWAIPSAARGVQDSMDDAAFFDFSHKMFKNQKKYSMDLVQRMASEVGADGCGIRGDAVNETYRPVLETDRQRAIDKGAQGTPAVYVNGKQVEPTWEPVKAAIESEL